MGFLKYFFITIKIILKRFILFSTYNIIWSFFKKKEKYGLGIDVGASSVKMVEMSVESERLKLENYAIYDMVGNYDSREKKYTFNSISILDKEAAGIIRELMGRASFKSKGAVFSIPVFSTFTTTIELPWMSGEEMDQAIHFKAKQYIPIPISEVVYAWDFVGDSRIQKDKKMNGKFNNSEDKAQIVLVAVPKEVINKYKNIAKMANLLVDGMESETFSLIRSIIGNDQSSSCLVDIGLRNTNIAIIEKGSLVFNRNLDTSGKEFTKVIAQGIGISLTRAEEIKRAEGLKNYFFNKLPNGARNFKGEAEVAQILAPVVDLIISEIDRMIGFYGKKSKRNVDKIILAGGSAIMPGLSDYVSKKINKTIFVGNPLSRVVYPEELKKIIDFRVSGLAVSIGAAMRKLKT